MKLADHQHFVYNWTVALWQECNHAVVLISVCVHVIYVLATVTWSLSRTVQQFSQVFEQVIAFQ